MWHHRADLAARGVRYPGRFPEAHFQGRGRSAAARPGRRSRTTPLLPNTSTQLSRSGGSAIVDAAGRLRLAYQFWNAPYTNYPAYGTCTTPGERRMALIPMRDVGQAPRPALTDQPPDAPAEAFCRSRATTHHPTVFLG